MSEGQEPARKTSDRGVIGGALNGAIHLAAGTVSAVGRAVGSTLGFSSRRKRMAQTAPGAQPGIDHLPEASQPPAPGQVFIHVYDYSQERAESYDVENVDAFLSQPKPEWVRVRWVNIDGLHPYVVNRFKQAVQLHTLAAEDILHISQRPRAEAYDDHLFMIGRMLQRPADCLDSEQIAFFLRKDLLVTFQEKQGDMWKPIRDRILSPGSHVRRNDASFLAYALIDAMIDHCFPILEGYSGELEQLEKDILENPQTAHLRRIQGIKRELGTLRRVVWPMRELVVALQHDESKIISKNTKTFLRDVYEHTVQVIEVLESFRDQVAGLADLHMSMVSNRLNEVMKVLTILASLFVPITFLAGVYGMNFKHMPELDWRLGYPLFWLLCLLTSGGLLVFFWRKGWIGRG